MAIDMKDTISLIAAAEQIKPPSTFLVDTFFPIVDPVAMSEYVMLEYRKTGREPAIPFVVEGTRGTNTERPGSVIEMYRPPMVAPRRLITQRDISQRTFGELPFYSTLTPEQRTAKLQADDLRDLISMIQTKKELMAAELLTTGKITVGAVADDNGLQVMREIDFDVDNEDIITTSWSNTSASIFDDIQAMVEQVGEDAGVMPSVMVCGSNVARYLRKNKELLDWLMIPNRETMLMASFAPRYQSPGIQWIGRLDVFGLDVYTYSATYTAADGKLTPFIDKDAVIIGIPGRGRQLHAAIKLLNDEHTSFEAYSAMYVPQYYGSVESNTLSLTVYSSFVLVPEFTTSWRRARVIV